MHPSPPWLLISALRDPRDIEAGWRRIGRRELQSRDVTYLRSHHSTLPLKLHSRPPHGRISQFTDFFLSRRIPSSTRPPPPFRSKICPGFRLKLSKWPTRTKGNLIRDSCYAA
ncbi:hypothetical protein BDZ89DRAFT_1071053 [Hymenopellis radicata]|nr:hypothetical protein BDZ89DRAFT_1071053 [Hymenopellis radicata]